MIVVSDTTAITNLLTIGHARLLPQLFGEIRIPEAVLRELLITHDPPPAYLVRSIVRNRQEIAVLAREGLGRGEAEAIVLAEELAADYLLIDERLGRGVARQRGVPLMGLVGVLQRAKAVGLIPAIRPLLDALEKDAHFWISERLRADALRDAGEA